MRAVSVGCCKRYSKLTSLELLYLPLEEWIGVSDPLAPGYVGTYSPPREYLLREAIPQHQPVNTSSTPMLPPSPKD